MASKVARCVSAMLCKNNNHIIYPTSSATVALRFRKNYCSATAGPEVVAVNPRATPLANSELCPVIMSVITKAAVISQVTKGVREVIRAVDRGFSDVVIFAADTEPFDILNNAIKLVQTKDVPYVFVPSKIVLARACEVVPSPVIACSLWASEIQSNLDMEILSLKEVVRVLHSSSTDSD